MEPNKALRSPEEPHGALRNTMTPDGALRRLTQPGACGGLRGPTAPYGALRSPTEPHGASRAPMEPYGAFWSPTGPCGGLWNPTTTRKVNKQQDVKAVFRATAPELALRTVFPSSEHGGMFWACVFIRAVYPVAPSGFRITHLSLKVDRGQPPNPIYFQGRSTLKLGSNTQKWPPKWSDLGPPTSGQVHWG